MMRTTFRGLSWKMIFTGMSVSLLKFDGYPKSSQRVAHHLLRTGVLVE